MGSCSFQPLSKPANANPVQARRRLGDDVWNIARRALSSTSTAELYAHRSEYVLVQYALFNTSHGHLFLLVRSTTSCRTVDSGAVRSLATLLRSASRLLLFNPARVEGYIFPSRTHFQHPQCTDVKGRSDSNRPYFSPYPERPVLGVPVRLAPQWTNAAA